MKRIVGHTQNEANVGKTKIVTYMFCAIHHAVYNGYAMSPLNLKELHHEDFAVLGQFCAKIITSAPFKTMGKISNEFY